MKLSVVICTYNPKPDVFSKVLLALEQQSFPKNQWELLVVDNCSVRPLLGTLDLSWHPFARVLEEKKPGLAHARVTGVQHSRADVIVFVDDDNLLGPDYLEKSHAFSHAHPQVGCFGGKSLPVFETTPPIWFSQTGINLGCQDHGSEQHISNFAASGFRVAAYPDKAPIGTGMVIKKEAFFQYMEEAVSNPERMRLGRRGKSLSSGEDNDIILTLVKRGYEIAYVPDLIVHHLIPSYRYTSKYLERMAFESNRTWIKVLQLHGINPHSRVQRWTLLPRKVRSYLVHRAWQSPLSFIRWKSSCGTFQGLAEI